MDEKSTINENLTQDFELIEDDIFDSAIENFNESNTLGTSDYKELNNLISNSKYAVKPANLEGKSKVIDTLLKNAENDPIKRPSWGPTATNGLKFIDGYKLIARSGVNLNSIRFLPPDTYNNNLNVYTRESFLEAIGINKDNFQNVKEQSKGYITVMVGNNSHNHAVTLLINLNKADSFEDLVNKEKKCYRRIDTKRFVDKTSFSDDTEDSRPKNLLKNRILPTQWFNECALQTVRFMIGFARQMELIIRQMKDLIRPRLTESLNVGNINIDELLNANEIIMNAIKYGGDIIEFQHLMEDKSLCK